MTALITSPNDVSGNTTTPLLGLEPAPKIKGTDSQFVPFHRLFQFAMFIRYFLEREIVEIMVKHKSALLRGFPLNTTIMERQPSTTHWILCACEKAVQLLLTEHLYNQKVDFLDPSMVRLVVESYEGRHKLNVPSAYREVSFIQIGSHHLPPENCLMRTVNMQLMIEAVKIHFQWLIQAITDRDTYSQPRVLGAEVLNVKESERIALEVLKEPLYQMQARLLIREVAGPILAEALGSWTSRAYPERHKITHQQYVVVLGRLLDLLDHKLVFDH
jgi:hypothetical protein